jgi:Tetratricopeptide repeat
MNARVAVALIALLVALPVGRAAAQADDHARPVGRATCQSGKQSDAVTQAAAMLERDPQELGARMRLADALVDQGCYQEAVAVLEAGQEAHPHSGELAAKLRDVRSLVTEQTYIEGLTQAAETARFQRNQLRCLRLADVTACDDALKLKPDDQQLLLARAEALKANAPPAPPPPPEAAAQVALADATAQPKPPKRTRPPPPPAAKPTPPAPIATVASLEAQPPRIYSNDAPQGRTN